MKRILLFAAVSVALTGCVNDETESFDATPSNKKITFEAPFLGKVATRATDDNVAKYPEDQSFKVWGWYHEGEYSTFKQSTNWKNWMDANGNAVEVSKDESDSWWKSSDAYYWPKSENGKLTFAAYSPADLKATKIEHTAAGLQITDFTVPVEANVDVMYSDRTYNQMATNNSNQEPTNNYTGVQIHFHHALSNICFTAKTEADYSGTMEIKITSIKVSGVENKGTFNQTITDGANAIDCKPAWNGSVEGTNEYTAYNETSEKLTTTAQPLGENLILLPQTFTENSNGIVTIDYTMNDVACSSNINLNQEGYPENWEPGKRYTYNIIIGLTEIRFAPYVTEWEDVTDTDVHL